MTRMPMRDSRPRPSARSPLASASLVAALLLSWLPGLALAQPAAPVVVEAAQPARIGESLRLTGTVSAEQYAGLSPRVDGLVADVLVDAGDVVTRGQVLLRQDDALARQALARLKAQSAEARARVAEAERLLQEARRLVQGNFVPASQVATRQAELTLAEAALGSAQAAEAEQAEVLARHALPAPFDGLVAARNVDVGEWVQRGATVLELVDTRRLRVDVQVPQERHGELLAGATFRLLPSSGQGVAASLQAMLPVVDPAARTFLLRLQPQQADAALLPGASTQVEIALPATEPALSVARDALLRRPDGSWTVFVVEAADGGGWMARERQVRILREGSERVAVASGLSAGEQVVVRGNEALRDGQAVTLQAPAAP